jgi:hypothetical protein
MTVALDIWLSDANIVDRDPYEQRQQQYTQWNNEAHVRVPPIPSAVYRFPFLFTPQVLDGLVARSARGMVMSVDTGR